MRENVFRIVASGKLANITHRCEATQLDNLGNYVLAALTFTVGLRAARSYDIEGRLDSSRTKSFY